MRILVVSYRFPANTYDASSNTVYRLVRHLSARHEVSLAALTTSAAAASQTALMAPYCHRIETVVLPPWRSAVQALAWAGSAIRPLQVSYYRSRRFARLLRRILQEERIEVAYGYHLRSAQFIVDLPIPRVIALQPAQALHFGRRAEVIRNPFRRFVYRVEAARLKGYERNVARDFDRALLISETDRRAIDPAGELDNVLFSPHGVDVESFHPPADRAPEPRTMIFSGVLGMDTNSDAILYFCREILPLVHRVLPDARLLVVGKDPPASVRALARDPRIRVTGFVEDMRPWLWRAAVAIDPLRIGAGLQNKILEAMAAKRPVVATTLANEGIGAEPDREILLADTPEGFAAQVLELFQSDARAATIAANAHRLVSARWSWEAFYNPLEQELERLAGSGPAPDRT